MARQPDDAHGLTRDAMPHANEAFSVEDTLTGAVQAVERTGDLSHQPSRQQDAETPNERAMRAATAARRNLEPFKRQ
jgi:hypothetical protein